MPLIFEIAPHHVIVILKLCEPIKVHKGYQMYALNKSNTERYGSVKQNLPFFVKPT